MKRVLCAQITPIPIEDRRFRRSGVPPLYVDGRVSRLDAAMAAGVTEDVIRSWHYRGWLDAAGERRTLTVHNGRYLVDEVLEAERDTRRKSGRSHRRLAPPEVAA